MATPMFKFTGMDERNTPKTEQLRYKNRGDSLTNLMNQSDLPGLKLHYRGKVGDMYDLGEHLLLVATDRISGFDVVNAALIPAKRRYPYPAQPLLVRAHRAHCPQPSRDHRPV